MKRYNACMRYLAIFLAVFASLISPLGANENKAAVQTQESVMPGKILNLAASGVPQAMGLGGLWVLHASADIGVMNTDDIREIFSPSKLTFDDQVTAYGFSLRVQRHLNDAFYLGIGFDSLAKSYEVRTTPGSTTFFQFTAINPSIFAGLTFYRGAHSFLFAQLEGGWLTLSQAGWEEQGGNNDSGDFSGSTFTTLASTGANWFVIPSVGLHASIGWRQARVENMVLSNSSNLLKFPTVNTYFVDYGGPQARIGISFFWGMKNPWGEMHEVPPPPPSQEAPME